MAQHPVKNTWKFISCEHGIAESAKLKRGENSGGGVARGVFRPGGGEEFTNSGVEEIKNSVV